MARELIYDLRNPGYTIYHRAALGGLAATLEAWKKGGAPAGINYKVESDRVTLAWDDALTDQAALTRILEAAFRLTDDKLINLVGHGIPEGESELRLAIHNGLCATFLQHNKMRPSEKAVRHVSIKSADGDEASFTYKGVLSYAHQNAQGTGLLDSAKGKRSKGSFPDVATIPQAMVPGAMKGSSALATSPDDAILLLFLMVGSCVFLLRSRTFKEKMQTCIVVPDVDDLKAFARALRSLATSTIGRPSPLERYGARIAGGPAEAALRFLVELRADDIQERRGISGVRAIAMGKVAWDKNQVNRSYSVGVGTHHREMAIFRAAKTYLGRSRLIKTAKGEGYVVPANPVPELVAANLATGNHWAAHFSGLVADKKDFNNMRFAQKGLQQMKQRITDEDDIAIIEMFQEAWYRRMGKVGERARRDHLDVWSLIDGERERMRNEILRAKTSDLLAGWFLRFCADATEGGSLKSTKTNAARLRNLLFEPTNVERLRNLFLFALLSYAKGESETQPSGES